MTDVLARTRDWFKKAVPIPEIKNFTTQIGVHFEEVCEMIAELTPRDMATHELLLDATITLKKLSEHLKQNAGVIVVTQTNRINYLDALCDQIVTATGCAHMSHLDIIGAMAETNRSNFSKFGPDGVAKFDENRKIAKDMSFYTKSDLTPFV